LAAALGKPTIEIYCDSPRWKTEAYWSRKITNLGDFKSVPQVNEVLKATEEPLKRGVSKKYEVSLVVGKD
jgi:heptosyltransferase-1